MSQLFGALQRLESENAGIDSSAFFAATGPLGLAEQHVIAEPETRFPFTAWPPPARAVEFPMKAEHQLNDRLDLFEQFQSLRVSVSPQSRLVCLTQRESLAAEKFNFLGVRLRQLRQKRTLKKMLITSIMPQEGKSMVAANLACTLARRTQQRTLLLEGDLRRPSLSQMFGLARIPGLCEWLQGERGPATSIYHLEEPGFWILPAGNSPKNPLEILQSGRLPALMEQLTAWFDWIVIDSPPVLPLADTTIWMRLVDGILLVTRQGKTEKQQLRRGLEVLEPTKLIGTLLNSSTNIAHGDYYCSDRPPTVSQPDRVRQDNELQSQ
ncbi:MAG TPA: CpsD/CapB family tyrosine-protein kinase [Candidatus Dormibacteraeota bacterium]|jgi:capsular exopolysaccharide synthesis family protein|nr:CpsD/CapB family tyrosine-protein kinase [Candidatus Dormibacteraeota bacterium]